MLLQQLHLLLVGQNVELQFLLHLLQLQQIQFRLIPCLLQLAAEAGDLRRQNLRIGAGGRRLAHRAEFRRGSR